MREHVNYDAFAILYRTNAQSRILEEACRKQNIPYRVYGSISFYQRKEIKDLLAWFRITINQNDEEALVRAITTPSRGIGKTTIDKINVRADEEKVSMWEIISHPLKYKLNINRGTKTKLENFVLTVRSFAADARVPIDLLEAELGADLTVIDDEDIDTLGGLVFSLAGRVPGRGELIRHSSGIEFEVLDADPRRIKSLRVLRPSQPSSPDADFKEWTPT